mgnify:CR=1 FL=1
MSNAGRNRAPGNRIVMVQHQKNGIHLVVESPEHQRLLAVKGKAGAQWVFSGAISANSFDFYANKSISQIFEVNKSSEMCWPEITFKQHIDGLTTGKTFPCNNVRRESNNTLIKSSADRRHKINHCLNIQSSRLAGTGKPTNSLELI